MEMLKHRQEAEKRLFKALRIPPDMLGQDVNSIPDPPEPVNCRYFGVVGAVASTDAVKALWQEEVSMLMRRTADVDPELIRNAEIRALTDPS